jgi:phage-related protein
MKLVVVVDKFIELKMFRFNETTYFCFKQQIRMDKAFDILFLSEAFEFLNSIDKKHYEKILYNIRKAQTQHDPELFKKLIDEIWEFRTLFQGLHYRLLAFWDKTNGENVLVISTHGFVKKRSKVPDKEIQKAKQIRIKYFEDKLKNKNK